MITFFRVDFGLQLCQEYTEHRIFAFLIIQSNNAVIAKKYVGHTDIYTKKQPYQNAHVR